MITTRLKNVITSKEASYWGFFVPAMVNSIACFLYSMGSNVTLGTINGILMLFFTGSYYLFCLWYFWNKERVNVVVYSLFIAIPLIMYGRVIQPCIDVGNEVLDIVLTSLYYIAFYGLFIVRNKPAKKVKDNTFWLNWKVVYTVWAVSSTGYMILRGGGLIVTSPLALPVLLYWALLGTITTIAGCYHAYQRHWIDALLYFCLFLFPVIVKLIRSIWRNMKEYLLKYMEDLRIPVLMNLLIFWIFLLIVNLLGDEGRATMSYFFKLYPNTGIVLVVLPYTCFIPPLFYQIYKRKWLNVGFLLLVWPSPMVIWNLVFNLHF